MKCECGSDMIWEGDFIFGKLVCKVKCAEKKDGLVWEEYSAADEARDAVLEDAGFYWRDGKLMTECTRCENRFEYECDPDELYADILAGVDIMRLCGGSYRCCP